MSSGGYEYTDNIQDAQIGIVNTCSFINSAKEESVNTILDVAELKNYKLKYLIVTGCLSQRYFDELEKELPEVDAFLGTTSFSLICDVVDGLKRQENKSVISDANRLPEVSGRFNLSCEYTQYIKIAEGCNNKCTYCIIPKLRGSYKSVSFENIIVQAEKMASSGTKEIILIAQDTSKYGLDLYGRKRLPELLKTLSEINGLEWIRFLYAYPEDIDENLIDSVNYSDKILPYFDMPVQHSSNRILKLMNRNTTREEILSKIKLIRDNIKAPILRTSLIAGFPTETEEDFKDLAEFISQVRFNKLGVFEYSREENTPAYNLLPQVDEETKAFRAKELMKFQQKISYDLNRQFIGKNIKVLAEETQGDSLICRSSMDAPEVDGIVYVKSAKPHSPGEFLTVHITDALEYDLIGEEI